MPDLPKLHIFIPGNPYVVTGSAYPSGTKMGVLLQDERGMVVAVSHSFSAMTEMLAALRLVEILRAYDSIHVTFLDSLSEVMSEEDQLDMREILKQGEDDDRSN